MLREHFLTPDGLHPPYRPASVSPAAPKAPAASPEAWFSAWMQAGRIRSQHPERYYFAASAYNEFTGVALTPDTLYAAPFLVETQSRWTRVGLRVTVGAATSEARLGIYADAGGVPGALLLDAGTVTTTTDDQDRELVISVTLNPGLYWLAVISDGAPSINCVRDLTAGFQNGHSSSNSHEAVYLRSMSYAPLPNNFGSGEFSTALGSRYPALWMRLV